MKLVKDNILEALSRGNGDPFDTMGVGRGGQEYLEEFKAAIIKKLEEIRDYVPSRFKNCSQDTLDNIYMKIQDLKEDIEEESI